MERAQKTAFYRLMESNPSPRVERLRKRWFSYKRTFNIDRIKVFTRAFKETDGEQTAIRIAKAFATVVKEIPINIYPDELIVGCRDVIPRGCGVFTDWNGPSLEKDLDEVRTRPTDPYILSDEDEEVLREEIFPFWRGPCGHYEKTPYWAVLDTITPEMKNAMFIDFDSYPPADAKIFSNSHRRESDAGHISFPDGVLKKGYIDIKRKAEERLNRLDYSNPEELKKIPFLKAVIIAMEAASEIGKRYADKARELASEEKDPVRIAELKKIAEVCDQVPAKPARTFHEAIQASWFYKMLCRMECLDYCNGFGRADQWLWNYYTEDLQEGEINRKEAQELLDCWFIKIAEGNHFFSNTVAPYYPGVHPFQVVTIGGINASGIDGTNELSYMLIEAYMHTRLFQPTIGVRLHSQTPAAFMLKVAKLVALGTGNPSFFNDEAVIPAILGIKNGARDPSIVPELARDWSAAGCIEATVPNHYGTPAHSLFNTAACLEFALNNGTSRLYKRRIGLETGDPRKFKTFEQVKEAFEKQVRYLTKLALQANNLQELAEAELKPTPFQSAFIEDCIERGLSKEDGGARYNFGGTGVQCGSADCGDSLAAIKKVVFDDKRATMRQLIDALDADFDGYEDLRQLFLNAPKFGNDDDYVDSLTAWAFDIYADEARKHQNTRGGYFVAGSPVISMYIPWGQAVGALPSGRKAGQPLADGSSPYTGMDRKGPTAVFNSMGKLDHVKQLNVLWNFRLATSSLDDGDRGFEILANLLRTFVDKKIWHLQINCVDTNTLRAAQSEPERYRDLVVRVAGYSAFFTELSEVCQDNIIARTEHRFQ